MMYKKKPQKQPGNRVPEPGRERDQIDCTEKRVNSLHYEPKWPAEGSSTSKPKQVSKL